MSKHCKKTGCVIIPQKPEDTLVNCCCYNDKTIVGADISGGWVNSTFPCDQCKEGDLVAQWKLTHDGNTPRSYSMIGLSDTCTTNDSFQEIDFAFYSILRTDVAVPYWIVYIYESGSNMSWFSYDRGAIPDCRDFEIRRVNGVITYLIDGNIVREIPDSTEGACLFLDDSWHGNLNTGVMTLSQTSVCQLEASKQAIEQRLDQGKAIGRDKIKEDKDVCVSLVGLALPEHDPLLEIKL